MPDYKPKKWVQNDSNIDIYFNIHINYVIENAATDKSSRLVL